MRRENGFALIDLIFVIGMIGVLAIIAMPRLLAAKMQASAASAIGSMRAISSGQLTFALTCGDGFYAPNLTSLGTAPPGSRESFIGGGLGDGDTVNKSGYVVQMTGTGFGASPSSCNGLAAGLTSQGFKAGADPADPSAARFFAVNAGGIIYEDVVSLYAAMPEVGPAPAGRMIR